MKRHTVDKSYPCNLCDKAFAHLSAHVIHMRRHTGDKSYPCSLCDKAFGHLIHHTDCMDQNKTRYRTTNLLCNLK